jgi:chemotaxis protein CheZ
VATIQMEEIGQAVAAAVRAEMADLRNFVDRRIAELSVEVHATTQLMDFSENNLSGQLATIHEQVAGLVAAPNGTGRNSGMELEAVVQATEFAANRIMEAAEAIAAWLQDGARDPDSIAAATEKVNAIFEACSFQDVTGQRIRRAIQHLQQVEEMLTDLSPQAPEPEAAPPPLTDIVDLSQDAVDAMFG